MFQFLINLVLLNVHYLFYQILFYLINLIKINIMIFINQILYYLSIKIHYLMFLLFNILKMFLLHLYFIVDIKMLK